MSDNRTYDKDDISVPHEMIQFIYQDVKEIKSLLNGPEGIVARVRVIEAAEEAEKWHFGLIWSAIVAVCIAVIGWWRK